MGLYGFFQARTDSNGGNLEKELPLNSVQGIIVNESGIYVGLGYYSRIQKYNHKGIFLKSWRTNTYSKDYTFKINSSGNPEILQRHILRNQIKNMFESEDNYEVLKILKEVEGNRQALNPYTFESKDGFIYRFKDGLFKQITKENEGVESVVITQSIFQIIFNGYSTPWTFGVLGMIAFLIININILKSQNYSSGVKIESVINAFKEIFK